VFRFKILSLIFIVIAQLQQPVGATDPAVKPLKFEALGINEGLSQGMVMSIVQDRYGFMWFGTKDGLNRYDGYRFKVFRNNVRDSASLSSNYVQCIYEDAGGRLWIGTPNGLNLFNRSSETFTRIMHDEKNPDSPSSDNVEHITEDDEGRILLLHPNVIDRLVLSEQNGVQKYKAGRSEPHPLVHYTLHQRKNKSYYLTCDANGLYYLSFEDFPKLHMTPVKSSMVDEETGKKIIDYRFVMLDTATDNVYACYSKNLVRINNAGHTTVLCTDCMDEIGNGTSCIKASENEILYGANRKLYRLNINTGERAGFVPWDINHLNASHHIFILYKDRSGMLWVGSNGYGLLKHNPFSENFHHTAHYSVMRMTLSEKGTITVNDDYIDKNVFEKERRIVYDSFASKNVKMYGEFPETASPSFSSGHYRWFASNTHLYRYDTGSGEETKWELPVRWQLLITGLVQCIYSKEGLAWVGTTEGLLKLNLSDGTWKQYSNVPSDTASLQTNFVLSICPHASNKNLLWIGTNGGGLSLMNKETEKFTAFTTEDGLPNDVVYGVLNDDEGHVWLSTNKGLSRFNPEKKTFKNYEEKDGLQSNEFNHSAYCRTQDGWLFFGGVNGFNYFNPKDFRDNKFIPQTIITDLKIRNKPVSFSDTKSPLKEPVYLSDEITLPYSENMISFEFASMDFTAPAKNMFQYKMEGFDESWIHAGNNHNATFTNLDPGTYTFMVKSSNHDGVWNEAGVSFIVTILPPWYITLWFRVFVVAAVAGLAYSFYRYRLNNALRLQEVRNGIAQDLHDEIGSNLSTISIFADMAISKSKNKSEHVTPLLNKINDYTQTSMEAMSDIVWMINSRNDRFENIIVHMRAHTAELLEAKNIELHMSFDERLNSVKLGMGERKNFYLIYKEALNNIVKYAECKNVWIEMKLNHSTVYLKIKDDGKGFNTATPDRGNGLINMQKRAEMLNGDLKIESTAGAGTTVTLQFSV
jgi:signal transduction histidine kinase/ligand-binding sensor domain-containing protein